MILYAGQISDQVIRETWARSRAEAIMRHRKEDEELERKYPGYREELQRQPMEEDLPRVCMEREKEKIRDSN